MYGTDLRTFWCRTVKIGQGVSTGWAKKFEKILNFSPFRDFTSIYLRNYSISLYFWRTAQRGLAVVVALYTIDRSQLGAHVGHGPKGRSAAAVGPKWRAAIPEGRSTEVGLLGSQRGPKEEQRGPKGRAG